MELGDAEGAPDGVTVLVQRRLREDHVDYRVLAHLGLARTAMSVGDLAEASARLRSVRDLLVARAPDGGLRPHPARALGLLPWRDSDRAAGRDRQSNRAAPE